jgi:hypothetical protein
VEAVGATGVIEAAGSCLVIRTTCAAASRSPLTSHSPRGRPLTLMYYLCSSLTTHHSPLTTHLEADLFISAGKCLMDRDLIDVSAPILTKLFGSKAFQSVLNVAELAPGVLPDLLGRALNIHNFVQNHEYSTELSPHLNSHHHIHSL